MCTYEILRVMHLVVFQFLNKRLLDKMTTFQLINNCTLFQGLPFKKLHFIFLNNKRVVYMLVYKHSRRLKNDSCNEPIVV
jgi:hypothetical protein